jgi:hypothetical protein
MFIASKASFDKKKNGLRRKAIFYKTQKMKG